MVALNDHIYPYAENVSSLPVRLMGIGGTEYQRHIVRETEACWDQFLICLNGKGYLNTGGESFELLPGDVFFMPRQTPHEYYPQGEKWETRWVVFDGNGISDTLRELGLTKPVVLSGCSLSELLKLFDKMFIALRAEGLSGNFTCSGLCYQFILRFHGLMQSIDGGGVSVRNDILMPVLDHIEHNFMHDLPLSDIVSVSGVSHQYLGRIFKRAMNTTVEQYIQNRRIWEAKRLLRETDKTVGEIAVLCGFTNPGYFSTVFRKAEGSSPKEYRSSTRI